VTIQVGHRSVRVRAAAFVVVGALATVLGLAGSGKAAAPSVFATASGTCTPANGASGFTTPAIAGTHPDPLVRLTAQAGPGMLVVYDDLIEHQQSFGGADTLWMPYQGTLGNGDVAQGRIECDFASGDVAYTVDFLDVPTTPTQFAGAITPPSGLNGFEFLAPAAAHYVAELTLSQGVVVLNNSPYGDGDFSQTFASSGQFDLGVLNRGGHGLSLRPLDGPQARWVLSIHALPVVLSNLTFDRQYERPTQITTASYALDGDVTLTATILNSSQQPVRTLAASAAIPQGDHSLTWDGLDGSGSPVADGSYALAVSYTDAAGNSGGARASIVVDGTPPTASMVSPARLPRTHGLVVQVADSLSGVKSASLSVDGTRVRVLGSGQTQFIYIPSGGWRPGTHSFSVSATDNAGNVKRSGGSVTVPQVVYAPDCVGKPRFKPRSIILTCADAGLLVGKINWTRWTRQVATGVGVVHWNDCKPDCARGHFHSRRGAHLTLSRVVRCKSRGLLEFARLRFTPPKSARATLAGRSSATQSLSCTSR
jgi:FlgD Ig-like domain